MIGIYSWGNPKIHKWTNKYTLDIGKFCSIAEGVNIIVDGNHRVDWVSMYPLSRILLSDFRDNGHPEGKGNMVIGNDVWLGMNCLILPGVSIGDGAVVAAGSLVVENVAAYEIVGGVPAKHLKWRFTPEQIVALEKIRWWDWELPKIIENIPLLENPNIDEFIKKHS